MMLFRKCVSGVRALALAAAAIGFAPLWQSGTAQAQVAIGISVNFAPPALPVYEQPICPGEGYIWTPGYWAWDPDYDDYYWVPGTWVLAPQPGFLWTPPWWGWNGVAFIFHDGYWGPRVGFYGGIDYGYGYPGRGYYGGRWDRDRFYYNRSVNNINVTQIHNVYNKTVINNVNVTRVSYNGGEGGVRERANRQEEQAFRERHVAAVAAQQQHIQEARADRALRASDNHGKPPIAATDRPGQFRGNVVPAREGRYNPPANRGAGNRPENRVENNRPGNARPENNVNRPPEANRPAPTARPDNRPEPRNDRSDRPPNARGPEKNNRPTYVHPNDIPNANRPDRPPSSGNAKADQKYEQRSDNMYRKQEQERQNLQKKQDQQHARAAQQHANDARRQQMENQHQQQTQKMEQRQQQQQQKMERQAPKPRPQPQPKQQQPKQQGDKPHGK